MSISSPLTIIKKILDKLSPKSCKWKKEFNTKSRAAAYDSTIDVFALRRDERMKVIETLLPEPSGPHFQILELGAGTGILTELLLECYPEAAITAIEGAARMKEKAESKTIMKENKARVQWINADYSIASWTKSVSGPFDLVIAMDSLHHLPHDRLRLLYKEAYDLLSQKGTFLISDHVTSGNLYYKDPQYVLWMQETLENLKRVEKGSDTAGTLEASCSWNYNDLQALSLSKLQKGFTEGLNREGENPMPLMQHIEALRETGFNDAVVEYRYSNFAIVSANKS